MKARIERIELQRGGGDSRRFAWRNVLLICNKSRSRFDIDIVLLSCFYRAFNCVRARARAQMIALGCIDRVDRPTEATCISDSRCFIIDTIGS